MQGSSSELQRRGHRGDLGPSQLGFGGCPCLPALPCSSGKQQTNESICLTFSVLQSEQAAAAAEGSAWGSGGCPWGSLCLA